MKHTRPLAPSPTEGVAQLIAWVVNLICDAWIAMLTLGVFHAEQHVVPTFGFWQCLLAVWAIYCIIGSGLSGVRVYIRKLGKMIAEMSKEGKVGTPEDSR